MSATSLTPGERIRRERKSCGLTQTQLAMQVSVNQSTVAKWERGGMPERQNLDALAQALGIPVRELVELYFSVDGTTSEDGPSPVSPPKAKAGVLNDVEGVIGGVQTPLVRLSPTHYDALRSLGAVAEIPVETLVASAVDGYLKGLVATR